jgi:hypothetical protein
LKLVLKRYINIACSILLALNIVLAYAGVTVYKMVCASENGRTVLSVVDVKSDCEHAKKKADCCRPVVPHQEHNEQSKSCCDYSHLFQKIDDETLVQQPQSSTNHILPEIVLHTAFHELFKVQQAEVTCEITDPPPLISLRKHSFQSFIQVFTI